MTDWIFYALITAGFGIYCLCALREQKRRHALFLEKTAYALMLISKQIKDIQAARGETSDR